MKVHRWIGSICLVSALGIGVSTAIAGEGQKHQKETGKTINRALDFIKQDTIKWRTERQCSTCHHGVMTVFALTEAKRQGYPIDQAFVNDTAAWSKARLGNPETPREPGAGAGMVNTMAMYLSLMAQNQPEQETLSAADLKGIAIHTARRLEDDGSAITPATMTPPLPKNGPPPTWESREVFTLYAAMAMQPGAVAVDSPPNPAVDSRKRALAYLERVTPGKDNQAEALRLLLAIQEKRSKKEIRAGGEGILARQNSDGGWSQVAGLPSDAYATGQSLYALNVAGVKPKRKEIRRAVAFLTQSQQADGSWPMTRRAHPGLTPGDFKQPLIFLGSAWATIGLVRSVPARN